MITFKIILAVFGFILLQETEAQLVSPCPRIFAYEPRRENGKWFAIITLSSESDLNGIWLRLIFDKKSLQLGNWFGDIKSEDNVEYLIKKRDHSLKANMPYAMRIFLQYNPSETPPKLVSIRLNAKTICPEDAPTTEAPMTGGQLITSNPVELSLTDSQEELSNKQGVTQSSANQQQNGYTDGIIFAGNSKRPAVQQNTMRPSGRPNHSNTGGQLVTDENRPFAGDTGIHQTSHNQASIFGHSNTVQCGVQAKKVTPLITHGTQSKEGDWPWHVALYTAEGLQITYICGGSLVSKKHVVTAAHCVAGSRGRPNDPDTFLVYLGRTNLKKFSPNNQERKVADIFIHPTYNYTHYHNDIAVMVLYSDVEFSDSVRPICLWSGEIKGTIFGKLGTVVGWGFDHNNKVSSNLQETQMPVVDLLTCIYSNPETFTRFTSRNSFCAGFRNGSSVCNGDSGGGLIFSRTNNQGELVYELRGLVSVSVALQRKYCDPNSYVVFTDITYFLDWINNIIK